MYLNINCVVNKFNFKALPNGYINGQNECYMSNCSGRGTMTVQTSFEDNSGIYPGNLAPPPYTGI